MLVYYFACATNVMMMMIMVTMMTMVMMVIVNYFLHCLLNNVTYSNCSCWQNISIV